MKFAFKTIVAAAALAAAAASQAAVIELTEGQSYKGLTASGNATLEFSQQLLGALDAGQIVIQPFGSVVPNITFDQDGFYLGAEITAPLRSASIDTATDNVVGAGTTGGAILTATALKGISNGGQIIVSDLEADLTAKVIRAHVVGSNAAGTYSFDQVIDLWSVTNIVGSTLIAGPGTYINELNGLTITAQGREVMINSLGLIKGGITALEGVTDYGRVTSTIVATAVPEPSTYLMMGVGMLAVGVAVQRRRKNG